MQSAFIQALTYEPPEVLGRQLNRFSSWHGLLLEACGSPYIFGGRADIEDVILVVWICSHTFGDGWQITSASNEMKKWGKKQKVKNLQEAASLISEYISSSFLAPTFWQDKKQSATIKAPYWWHNATYAMTKLGVCETKAWDYPIAKLACYEACSAEITGNSQLMSEDDLKGLELLKQEKEKTNGNTS